MTTDPKIVALEAELAKTRAELAAWSLIASAALLTIELGARLSPSSLFPSYRWPVIGAYWAYAIAAWWWIRRRAASPR